MAKKRLTMFDAMDGALSRISSLSDAAARAKTLPFRIKQEDPVPYSTSPNPEIATDQGTGAPQQSTTTEHLIEAGQEGRTREQDNGAGEQDKRAGQGSSGAGQGSTSREQDKRALQPGTPKEQDKEAGQEGRTREQDNGARQRGTPAAAKSFLPVLLDTPCAARTPAQRKVLAYFETHGSHVSNYDKIIGEIGLPYNTVRKGINKLVLLGMLTKAPWSQGSARGLQFTFHGQMGQDKRTGQKSISIEHHNGAGQEGRTRERDKGAGQRGTSYAPLMKIDRKNLSISLSAIQMAWPHLARAGFGPDQVDQIVATLEQLGKSTDRIVQGLDHAEWELAEGKMLDKEGRAVADPCAWVFRSLAGQGYYRRPPGYVSAEEQANLDAEAEAKAVMAAREKAELARFEAWRGGLSPEELAEAMRGHPGGPKDAWLRKYWRDQVEGN